MRRIDERVYIVLCLLIGLLGFATCAVNVLK